MHAKILITTNKQYASDAKSKKQPPSTPDSLMMSVAAYPLSSNLKNKNCSTQQNNAKPPQPRKPYNITLRLCPQ
jgi:hypothetical protein